MENKKETAIDYLKEQILDISPNVYNLLKEIDAFNYAKEIHKQQSIEDMNKMQIISDVDFDGNVTFVFNPENYYQETYGEI